MAALRLLWDGFIVVVSVPDAFPARGAMRAAMERLHLHPAAALSAVIGIFVGGLFNIPVYRIEPWKNSRSMSLVPSALANGCPPGTACAATPLWRSMWEVA